MARIKQGVFSWEDVLAQRYQNNKPAALPRSRRHSVLSGRSQSQKQTDTRLEWISQPDCSLLMKLAPELRLLIWEMVLGGMRIHIIQRPNRRMSHILAKDGAGRRKTQLLSLALTCKLIYCESIHLLYTLNIFEFSNTWSLTYLRPTIPADFWDCIRAVELRWAFPGHWLPSKDPVKSVYFSAGRQQWVETCRALTRMEGLQSFTLQLMGNWFCEPVEKIPIFLEPLRELNLKNRWKLQLPRQPYYIKEIRNIDGDLRQRGIDCSVRAA
ncbi:hypothetical protein ALT_4472 [Aspergillus lentulus]|uniref:DUF7730 domain-containing protein n=1 Tax=Aspergillus lentulus TaxID=293939 RepID=A0AAN4PJN4_ASPLE|nr:hypothetical protein CNMCM6069_006308 [Aspergillus lentulus]KAF4164217.1 hypothetical protein CNMCM6936_009432 [Aspergillus lentulus]KAF4177348.1 hypothetical protein CNMCM8060_005573 [Aspergillus lentulus]KAF4185245.1 hypothetical protein CNMCM7927_006918 [Aspergillus lentulus]KAF4197262.1 hypothetical protein CNMCM8694_003206 [Aspergillus lentulus]